MVEFQIKFRIFKGSKYLGTSTLTSIWVPYSAEISADRKFIQFMAKALGGIAR